jgi:ABC-type dipeptide/oligopeptide/nickel transport system ATPase component
MRVQLSNVGIIKSCDVEFNPGINLIIGSSGSGKSTLMRCLYNMAVNEFSDSDIAFGSNTMNVNITVDNNVIEYSRSLKAKGERFYYTVNNEVYTKVGRTALPAVSNVLKIGNVNINGEEINFNFNLQFSSPFLILGSQSTLYNVLTYRSTFDISSINDYYVADIKSNASDLAANTKLKEQLESSLASLETHAELLRPVETLYSDYMAYKHKSELLSKISNLRDMMISLDASSKYIYNVSNTINSIQHVLDLILSLNDIKSYEVTKSLYDGVILSIEIYNNLINSYEKAIDKVQEIQLFSKLNHLMKYYDTVSYNREIIEKCIPKNTELRESLVNDVVKQKYNNMNYNKCSLIVSLINSINSCKISYIDDMLILNDKLLLLDNVNKDINNTEKKCVSVNKRLSQFDVCPLCGNHLAIQEHK